MDRKEFGLNSMLLILECLNFGVAKWFLHHIMSFPTTLEVSSDCLAGPSENEEVKLIVILPKVK